MSDLEGHVTSTFKTGVITNDGATTAPANSYVICDRSGFRARVYPDRSSELIPEWDNLMILPEYWEPRQSQDFVRARAELLEGAIRPEPDDVFTTTAVKASDL